MAVLPFEVVAVIVAVPVPTAVTVPLLTFATASLLDDHVTVLSVAFAGATVAVRSPVSPTWSLRLVGAIVTPVGFTMLVFSLTVTFTVAVRLLCVVAVIVAVPLLTPLITPPETVATEASLVVHLTDLLVAFEGATVAVTDALSPSRTVTLDLLSVTPVASTISTSTISPPMIVAAPPSPMKAPLGTTRPGAGVLLVLRT